MGNSSTFGQRDVGEPVPARFLICRAPPAGLPLAPTGAGRTRTGGPEDWAVGTSLAFHLDYLCILLPKDSLTMGQKSLLLEDGHWTFRRWTLGQGSAC